MRGASRRSRSRSWPPRKRKSSRCSKPRWSKRRWRPFRGPSSPATISMNNGAPEMPDFDEILKMAQNAQAGLMKAQEGLDKIEVEGLSGGGLVKIRATAKGRIISVDLDESLLVPSEKQMVEDLVAAAINDARVKADQAAQTEMSKMTAGLQLPPGFKMPF